MAEEKAPGLALRDIVISLNGRTLIRLTAEVAPGEVLTVMGPSGSGKSSLLAYIGGFLDPAFRASGTAEVDGVELTALRPEARHVGILFQDPLLFPHMSVAANIAFAVPADVKDRRARRAIAEEALAEVEMADFGDRDPDTLSGGQKARVALVRVLVSHPRLLLLDEPFSKLDMSLRDQARELVFARARQARLPVILVTHDAADAAAADGQLFEMSTEA